MSAPLPLDASLFTSHDPLRLAGSRCAKCGTTTFPRQLDCPRCAERTMVDHELPSEGVLWSWTVQTFEPKPPYVSPLSGFEPFVVGYVDLGPVVVETRIDADPARVVVGERLRLVPLKLTDGDGSPVYGYAFAPLVEDGMAS